MLIMNLLKKKLEVLRKVFKLKTIIIAFSVMAVVLGTSVLLGEGYVEVTDTPDTIFVDDNGNVGIGTDSLSLSAGTSSKFLEIQGDVSPGIILSNTQSTGHNYFLYSQATGNFRIWDDTAAIVRFTIGPTGNVGIGSSNPSLDSGNSNKLLEIRGDINPGIVLTNTETNGHKYFLYSQTDGNFRIWDDTASIVRFSIGPTGNVGIGGMGTPEYKLDVDGTTRTDTLNVDGTTSSNLYRCSSDARYKKNVSPYDNTLEKVLGLRGVSYFWKADEYKERNFSKDKQVGFIAQEVEKIIPELVYTDDKGYKTMSYDRLTAVIVEAIKEMKIKNDIKISALEKRSMELEKENAHLKQKLAKLDVLTERLAVLEKTVEKQGNKKLVLR